MNSLQKWLKAEIGRNKLLANSVGVSGPAITQWAASQVPAERVFAVSKITGIRPHLIRPDIFPKGTRYK